MSVFKGCIEIHFNIRLIKNWSWNINGYFPRLSSLLPVMGLPDIWYQTDWSYEKLCYSFRDSLIKILLFSIVFYTNVFFNIIEEAIYPVFHISASPQNKITRQTWIWIPPSPLTDSMTLDHYLISLSLDFLICKMEIISINVMRNEIGKYNL